MNLGCPVDSAIHTVFFGIKAGDRIAPRFKIGRGIHVKATGSVAEVCSACTVHIINTVLTDNKRVTDVDIRAFHVWFSFRVTVCFSDTHRWLLRLFCRHPLPK